MPVKEFSGDSTVQIRDGQGAALSTHPLPFSGGRIIAKPKRPDGPAFRELVDGRRKERRAKGFYLDVSMEWEELSIGAHANLVGLVDALHVRASSHTVWFSPESPIPIDALLNDLLWRVVPAISKGDIDVVYENRVRTRPGSLTLKAHDAMPVLPDWFD